MLEILSMACSCYKEWLESICIYITQMLDHSIYIYQAYVYQAPSNQASIKPGKEKNT